MEDIFSSNSANVIQKTIDLSLTSNVQSITSQNIDFYFDIEQISEWINKNEYTKVGNLYLIFILDQILIII
jgi:hypothetical protein